VTGTLPVTSVHTNDRQKEMPVTSVCILMTGKRRCLSLVAMEGCRPVRFVVIGPLFVRHWFEFS
jgi:hypothetical protein